jgi:hypothetical protein
MMRTLLSRPLRCLCGALACLALALTAVAAGAAESEPAGAPPTVRVRSGEHPGFSRLVFDWTRYVEYRVASAEGRVTVSFPERADFDLGAVRRELPRLVGRPEARPASQGARGVDVVLPTVAGVRVRHFRDGPHIVIDLLDPVLETGAGEAAAAAKPGPAEAPAAKPPPARSDKAAKPPQALPDAVATKEAPLAPLVQRIDGGLSLLFPWREPVAAVAFTRGDRLWIAFDRSIALDLSALQRDAATAALEPIQISHPHATVLRLRLPGGTALAADRRDDGWRFDLRPPQETLKAPPIVPEATPSPAGVRLTLPVAGAAAPIHLEDPEIGDRLIAVPVGGETRGVPAGRRFVQFALLPSAQGVAIEPRSDGIEVGTLPAAIEISAGGGLVVSAAAEKRSQARAPRLDYASWRGGGREQFEAERQRLQHATVAAPAARRNAARLDLARYLFAHGFDADAVGVLAAMRAVDAEVERDPAFRALRGAARLRLGQVGAAAADLQDGMFDGDPEMALWRGHLAAARGDWAAARQAFAEGSPALAAYPPDVRGPFRLLMTRAVLAGEDLAAAAMHLAALDKDALDRTGRADALLLKGETAKARGALDEAEKLLQQAAEAGDPRVRALAEYDRVELALAKGSMDTAKAIDRLEALRFAWRGDAFEFKLLHRIGALYLAQGDYRSGFAALRRAASNFPKAPETAAITQRMAEEFARLFLQGGADRLSPLAALAIYYDFRELTPVGERGDEMIRRLADRLAAVDLLGQAAELMEHQVAQRLHGEEQARVATRLAVLRLLDRKPEAALKALRTGNVKAVPAALTDERRLLEARALADLERYAEALVVLGADRSRAADELRADIHWRAKDWPRAAESLRLLLGDQSKAAGPLDAGQRRLLLRQAVALSLAGDAAKLAALRDAFGPRLAGTPEGDAFAVVSGRVDPASLQFRQAASAIAGVDQLEAFLTSYRQKLAKGGLSAIN